MIVRIPEDIYAYEPKIIGNLTGRQALFTGVAAALLTGILLPLYFATHDTTFSSLIASLVATFVMLMGRMKKDGLPYEKYLYLKIKSMNYPSKRPFRMTNLYESFIAAWKEMKDSDKDGAN